MQTFRSCRLLQQSKDLLINSKRSVETLDIDWKQCHPWIINYHNLKDSPIPGACGIGGVWLRTCRGTCADMTVLWGLPGCFILNSKRFLESQQLNIAACKLQVFLRYSNKMQRGRWTKRVSTILAISLKSFKFEKIVDNPTETHSSRVEWPCWTRWRVPSWWSHHSRIQSSE